MIYQVQKGHRSAFTLIEILVVVAIIALLISILLPSLARARANAKSTLCVSQLHQLCVAMQTYAVQWKDVIPRGAGAGDTTTWVQSLNYAMGDRKKYTHMNQIPVDKLGIVHCPERSATLPSLFVDYVVNAMHRNGPLGDFPPGSPPAWTQISFSRLNLYRRPSDVMYLCDAEREDKNTAVAPGTSLRQARENWKNTVWNPPPPTPGSALDIMDVWKGEHLPESSANPTDDPGPRRVARKMHLDRFTNAGFLDGHATGLQLANRTSDVDNYALWLIRLGVQDVDTVKTLPLN